MNVCIIGDGLTSLSLAKNLVNKKINVHIYHKNKSKPIIIVAIQKVSISLLVTNFSVFLANLVISIKLMNQINHFVSSNVYC